jgi:hypothetical protein
MILSSCPSSPGPAYSGEWAGLTDEEYLWEPVANCRTVRPREDGSYGWDASSRSHELDRALRATSLVVNEVEPGTAADRVPGGQADPRA